MRDTNMSRNILTKQSMPASAYIWKRRLFTITLALIFNCTYLKTKLNYKGDKKDDMKIYLNI